MISSARPRGLVGKGEGDTHNHQPLDLLGIDGKKYKTQDIKHSGLPISDDFGRLLGGFNQMLDQEQSLSLDMTAGLFTERGWLMTGLSAIAKFRCQSNS